VSSGHRPRKSLRILRPQAMSCSTAAAAHRRRLSVPKPNLKIEIMTPNLTTSILASIVCLCLSACAGPTRDEPGAFTVLAEGVVANSNAPAFADCLLDGFDKAHYALTIVNVRQQRRADSFRVETTSHSTVMVSADVFDDGRVRLYESPQAALLNTSGEREAFQRCLERYRSKV